MRILAYSNIQKVSSIVLAVIRWTAGLGEPLPRLVRPNFKIFHNVGIGYYIPYLSASTFQPIFGLSILPFNVPTIFFLTTHNDAPTCNKLICISNQLFFCLLYQSLEYRN